MQFGNIGINLEAFKDITKDEFLVMFKGKMNYDINKAWDEIQAALGPKKSSLTNYEVTEYMDLDENIEEDAHD